MFYFSIISFTGCIELAFAKNHIYWLAFAFGYVVVARNDVKQVVYLQGFIYQRIHCRLLAINLL